MSNCTVVSLTNSAIDTYPLTNYTLVCTANIYYKTRCTDSPASFGFNYSRSQQTSVCRQQRMGRINSCLNSTVQLTNVPCLISVSSGQITNTSGACSRIITANIYNVSLNVSPAIIATTQFNSVSEAATPTVTASGYTYTAFSVSDQTVGHVYQISNINSQNYPSTRKYYMSTRININFYRCRIRCSILRCCDRYPDLFVDRYSYRLSRLNLKKKDLFFL
jgi:hypothetical protein